MTAAAPLELPAAPPASALGPVTLDDTAQLREAMVACLPELDGLIVTAEAAALEDVELLGELRQRGARVRLLLQLAATRVDGISAHLRAHLDLARARKAAPR